MPIVFFEVFVLILSKKEILFNKLNASLGLIKSNFVESILT
ncbi:hypothetical protein FEM21_01150 [Flavobacterium seoulense]|uniref:Uncharacterized protein n=1 Tax=Flavobacterium seoulense TaxID=1492738 RepID=A0A066WRC4_9FLAO|nr:hypothetical protein FEM21_01150 [Flavobacterium seoulense]